MTVGWSFAILMALLPLLGVSDYRKFAVCLPFETETPGSLTYVVFLMVINGVAFLILMGCYLKMYCAIRGSQAWNSNDSRIAKRMALLVFTDFLCWSPIAFFSLTAAFGLQLISLEQAKVCNSAPIETRDKRVLNSDRTCEAFFQIFSSLGQLGFDPKNRIENDKVIIIFSGVHRLCTPSELVLQPISVRHPDEAV